ncbi:hypothetical protein [Flavobacterium johnsoniae]|jgi:hypothetical protein|uniref:Glycosyl hydrolase family 32 N-terminal domain-containing protein n=1 Tax=Flavobacterium johnsoniae (strain ATCC 17061 / DSM 2064 / JCM 8514 / BCRC 14874 / CCUG 350202 / NBRC 14942 / NCIMB 11054 / UW101) TaxID=376686 RepID=A5FN70_FLAJ1|nr:hypothetical protein [Flavobacterium johnsoniae]ABQ03355.1 hypothetical protein Fjoh_0319 [Flavobacterium johnsoniae UW101]OXG01229.1 hypothetical protein B0A63_06895 [Flavobacterium johnsoniae UW101]WQG79780.1 hypothetical protein SR927_17330 [Flavobacterium johnsoniae UW101]SHL77637.1 hypothetical protein SAMN05444146_4546 [Flavobacterium johnsoniae]
MWKKKGLLFNVSHYKNDFIKSHASIPFAYHVEENMFRIYFSSRNEAGKSFPFYINAIVNNGNIEVISDVVGPILELGRLGTFDDSGIMPSCLIKSNDKLLMYYIGWNPQITVSYRLSIGLAISYDNGLTFQKFSEGPICDRNISEPYFNTAPYIIIENNVWKMWYISCTGWEIINNYPEPSYHVKYAESDDGINWERKGTISLDYDEKAKALGRPCVLKEDNKYVMYFSYRNTSEYRTSSQDGYKLGLALSYDGVIWEKKYEDVGIALSNFGWDSQMMEYCHVFEHMGFTYMLYNGNDFGKEGFGYAVR